MGGKKPASRLHLFHCSLLGRDIKTEGGKEQDLWFAAGLFIAGANSSTRSAQRRLLRSAWRGDRQVEPGSTDEMPLCFTLRMPDVRPADYAAAACAAPRTVNRGKAERPLSFPFGPFGLPFPLPRGSFCSRLSSPKDGIVKREKASGCSLGQIWDGSYFFSDV